MVQGWDIKTRGSDAVQSLRSDYAKGGWSAPFIPAQLESSLVMAETRSAWTSDPNVASPYAAWSLWEGEQGPAPMLVSMYTRTTPYMFIGHETNVYNTLSMIAVRFGSCAVVLQTSNDEGLWLTAMAALSRVLLERDPDEPMTELTHWLWSLHGKVTLARRASSDVESSELYSEFAPSKWNVILDQETYFGANGVTEAWESVVSKVDEAQDPTLTILSELGRTVVDRSRRDVLSKVEKVIAPPPPTPPTVRFLQSMDFEPQLIQMAAWRCFAELHRRHPQEIDLYLEWYPAGGWLLGAIVKGGALRISLNFTGLLHAWDNKERSDSWRAFDGAWDDILRHGISKAVPMLEQRLGLEERSKPLSATPESLTTRAIAALLARDIFSAKQWSVQPVFPDASRTNLFERAKSNGLLGTPPSYAQYLPSVWVVLNDKFEEVAMLSPAGSAVSTSRGGILNLERLYRDSGKDIQAVVSAVFGTV